MQFVGGTLYSTGNHACHMENGKFALCYHAINIIIIRDEELHV